MKSKKSLEKLYDDLFSTNFLINYGYFDITPKNNQDITDLNSYGKSDAFYLKIFNMSKLAAVSYTHLTLPTILLV